jgi:hypothetical protein
VNTTLRMVGGPFQGQDITLDSEVGEYITDTDDEPVVRYFRRTLGGIHWKVDVMLYADLEPTSVEAAWTTLDAFHAQLTDNRWTPFSDAELEDLLGGIANPAPSAQDADRSDLELGIRAEIERRHKV